jgi:hypothetical protein
MRCSAFVYVLEHVLQVWSRDGVARVGILVEVEMGGEKCGESGVKAGEENGEVLQSRSAEM